MIKALALARLQSLAADNAFESVLKKVGLVRNKEEDLDGGTGYSAGKKLNQLGITGRLVVNYPRVDCVWFKFLYKEKKKDGKVMGFSDFITKKSVSLADKIEDFRSSFQSFVAETTDSKHVEKKGKAEADQFVKAATKLGFKFGPLSKGYVYPVLNQGKVIGEKNELKQMKALAKLSGWKPMRDLFPDEQDNIYFFKGETATASFNVIEEALEFDYTSNS